MSDLIADAAAWLRDDPSFRTSSRTAQEAEAAAALLELGGEADDPLTVALVVEAALGPVAAPPAGFVRVEVAEDAPQPARVSARLNAALNAVKPRVDTGGALLYRVKAATGWPDRELAEALGISRATVQAYIGGRLVENLTADNLKRLRDNLAQRQAALAAVLADVEGRL